MEPHNQATVYSAKLVHTVPRAQLTSTIVQKVPTVGLDQSQSLALSAPTVNIAYQAHVLHAQLGNTVQLAAFIL